MNELFQTEPYKYILIFPDNILMHSETLEKHADHIRCFFVTLGAANLQLRPKRRKFFQSQVDFLGYIIDQNGQQPELKERRLWDLGRNQQQWRVSDHSEGFATAIDALSRTLQRYRGL